MIVFFMYLSLKGRHDCQSLYILKATYENGKRSSRVVEKLGSLKKLKLLHTDPMVWANEHLKILMEDAKCISVIYNPDKPIEKGKQNSYNGGYLFLQKIYNELKLGSICNQISDKYNFEFDLNEILSKLVFSRILFPASKLATLELSKKFFEQPKFELQHIYRALEVIAKEMNLIQSQLYINSANISTRKTNILYFDCTNYFFEIEQEANIKKYGLSKDHKPNPIVQMGLFIDEEGIPLAFNIFAGNENEQQHMLPLEQKILDDFKLAKFIVCTDAGLSSLANREFNSEMDRNFVTTQSIQKLQGHLQEWCLDQQDWKVKDSEKTYDLSTFLQTGVLPAGTSKDTIFYRERWINENDFMQRLVVTFSPKYREYKQNIRAAHVARAEKAIKNKRVDKTRATDPKRLIKTVHATADGEIAIHADSHIDKTVIEGEAKYDGFYAICTSLEISAAEVLKIARQRWEIEECFRIMKSELKARPVFLRLEDRIKAHFTTCFIALIIYRFLEKRVNTNQQHFTCETIIDELREMNFTKVPKEGYIPAYTRTAFTDALHERFNFRTDREILTTSKLQSIIRETKK